MVTLPRVQTAKHFRLIITDRTLLHHSDLVTPLFSCSVIKGLLPVVQHKGIWLADASVDFENGLVVLVGPRIPRGRSRKR
jgi:hypothetical protein